MKIKQLLILFGLILISNSLIAQVLLKPSTSKKNINNKYIIEEKITSREGYETYQIIDLDLNALNQNKNIEAFCFDSKIIVEERNKFVRGIKNYSWFGSNDDYTSSISLSVSGQEVQGFITQKNELYKIETINNEYILLKINQSELNKKTCGTTGYINSNESIIESKGNTDNNFSQKSIKSFSCKIRILVMYTPKAAENVNNMQVHAQLSVDQLNHTFLNSNVSAEAELVHVQLTNYTEVTTDPDTYTDLSRFTVDGDGYMDEVHDLRNQYSADVCVLMSDVPNGFDYVGVASSIKSSAQNSFCIVDYDASTSNLTFSHEIGHLIGCRHDEVSDADNAPYTYGHGYVSVDNGSWRTIMGTAYPCEGCPRNPFWSNPNVSIPFGVTGTVSTNDNARVIDENYENFKSHRPTNETLIVNQPTVDVAIGNTLYNSNYIKTYGNVMINYSETFSLFAGNKIDLNSGFSADGGSDFIAEIVFSCGEPDGLPSDYEFAIDSNGFRAKNSINNKYKNYLVENGKIRISDISVFPNPTKDELNFLLELPEDSDQLKISIVNFNGQLLKEVFAGPKQKGIHKLNTSISSLNPGVYFVLVTIDNTDIISHKIIKQ